LINNHDNSWKNIKIFNDAIGGDTIGLNSFE
jgi:hypothetical protein